MYHAAPTTYTHFLKIVIINRSDKVRWLEMLGTDGTKALEVKGMLTKLCSHSTMHSVHGYTVW